MLRPHTVLGFGIWLVAVSLLGMPSIWKIRLYVATGVLLILVYLYYLGRETILKLARQYPREADTFTENGAQPTKASSPQPSIERKNRM